MLRRARHVLDKATIACLYKSHVRSVMEYCCPIWMGNATSGLARLDAVQRSAERLMGPAEASKLQLLSHRRGVAVLSCFHRIVHGSAPVAVLPLCPPRAPPQTRPLPGSKACIPPAENTPRSPHSHALVLAEQLRAPPFSGMERPGPVDSIHRRPSNVQERGEQLKPPPLTSVSLSVLALVLCLRILHLASQLVLLLQLFYRVHMSEDRHHRPSSDFVYSSGRTHPS